MKERIDVTIDKEVLIKFRKRFVNKKGDLSKAIENLMISLLKGGNQE